MSMLELKPIKEHRQTCAMEGLSVLTPQNAEQNSILRKTVNLSKCKLKQSLPSVGCSSLDKILVKVFSVQLATGLYEQGMSFSYFNEKGEQQRFFAWKSGEPNHYNQQKENFVYIDRDGKWVDTLGTTKFHVFCYRQLPEGEYQQILRSLIRILECQYLPKNRQKRVIGIDDALLISGISMATSYLFDEFTGHRVNQNTLNDIQAEVHGVQEEIKSDGLLISKLNKNFE